MPQPSTIALINLAVLVALMLILWIVSLLKRDVSIADQFWGCGSVVVAWVTMALVDRVEVVDWVTAGLVSVWGLRLAAYLTWRKWGEREDRRYAEMRDRHGDRFSWVSLFTVFLLQGLLIWFISMPVQAAIWNANDGFSTWLMGLGVGLWTIGFCCESVADFQLARFKARPENEARVMDQGVWRYSRHPNYFGDFCIWWGLYLIAVSTGAAWAIASPLVMSFLLLKVSGVTLLEETISDRRPDYRDYKLRTNAFFPWWPRG